MSRILALTPVRFIASIILSFAIGFGLGTLGLMECRVHSRLVEQDLRRAVARGVVVETNLILCQQSKEQGK